MKLPPSKSFEDLLVWQKAHQLVLGIYKFSSLFPVNEVYGLTSQLRRSAVSMPANIAEGYKKYSKLDKIRFFNIAQGSAEETKYHLILARDLNYGDSTDLLNELEEVIKMLESYIKMIRVDVKKRK